MNTEMVQVKLNDEMIKDIAIKSVQHAIGFVISEPEKLINQVVNNVLTMKVDAEGKVGSYRNNHDLIEVLASKTIRKMANEAIIELFEKNKSTVKKTIKKAILANPDAFTELALNRYDRNKYSVEVKLVNTGYDD